MGMGSSLTYKSKMVTVRHMASQTLWNGYFQSFVYSIAFKFKMDDVRHLENSSSGAKNSTYNALVLPEINWGP